MISGTDLKRILAREHGRLSKVLAVLAFSGEPAKVAQIMQTAQDHGFRKMREWNVSSILSSSRGKALLINGLWEITEDGQADVDALVPGRAAHTPAKPAAEPAEDFRAEVGKIVDPTTRAFAEEAVRAYEAKLYRSAIVMSWLAAVDVLYQAVLDTKLAEFNSEADRVSKGKWRFASDRDGLSAPLARLSFRAASRSKRWPPQPRSRPM